MIRPARAADLPAVRKISAESPSSAGWSPAQLEQEIQQPRGLFLAAEEGGEVVGYGLLWIVGAEAQIFDLAVNLKRRRRGIGKALLGALAEGARSRNCLKATLEVSADNSAARRLYLSAGFKVVGRRTKFYNDGADAVLMDLRL